MSGRGACAFVVGLISDTHGLLRPEALEALAGAHHIVHAGDIGEPSILEALEAIAPLTAIKGNNDTASWTRRLRATQTIELAGATLHVVHDLAEIALDPARRGIDAVISGHSHRPKVERRGGVLYVNPGSAGPRRFTLPVSVGRMSIAKGAVEAQILELRVAAPRRRSSRGPD